MKISETLQKSSPLIPKREMSKTEYMKLVDANTELVDKMNDLQERIDKAIEYVSNLCNYANVEYYSDNQLKYITIRPYYIEKLLNILEGEDKE